MSIIGSNILAGASGQATGYNINNSLRFRTSNSAYLSRTPATSNRRTFTYSAWVKRGILDAGATLYTLFSANAAGADYMAFYQDGFRIAFFGGTYPIQTTQVFRDPSAWYHIVIAVDTTQATAANRIKLYINGIQVTAFSTATYPPQNYDTNYNLSTVGLLIGQVATSSYFDGYMTEINFVDGTALTPSSFGETSATTGSWIPKKYTGSYGTNGFYLNFTDIAQTVSSNVGLGKDFSGNTNYWVTNNISTTAGVTYDAMLDVPTNTSATVGNYCTINPLRYGITYTPTVSEGNLKVAWAADTSVIIGTMNIPSSGKWYWEAVVPTQTYNLLALGVVKNQETSNLNGYLGTVTTGYGVYVGNGNKLVAAVSSTYMAIPSQNTVVTVAFDADTGTLYIGAGGLWANGSGSTNQAFSSAASIVTGLTGDISPAFSFNTGNAIVNFGQRPFTYTPPTGYKALNTYNLPDSTIVKGNTVMDATLYTGTRATQVVVNAGGFKPDLVWCKGRSFLSQTLASDSVRGVTKQLFTPLTNAEQTDSTMITSFNSNGFTLGDGSGGPSGNINFNIGATYVGWQWQAGQGTNTSNTNGSITSTVSVNTTAGFSVVTYTGTGANATVGHGLGVAPKWIIVKARSAVNNWPVYHINQDATPQNGLVYLDATNAYVAASTIWNNTAPTSTTFAIGTSGATNASGVTFVAYCWAEIAGFSKFGSYTGNASTDGPFVYLGFRPKFVMVKSSSAASNWFVLDSMRDTSNVATRRLFPNLSNAEDTSALVDFTANGFKLRMSTALNDSATYIYMAFAENPFKNSNAR